MVNFPEALLVEVSKGENKKPTGFTVMLTLVKILEMSRLDDYIRGRALSIPRRIQQNVRFLLGASFTQWTQSLVRRIFSLKQMSVLDFLEKQITGFNLLKFGTYRKNVENLLIGLKVQWMHRGTPPGSLALLATSTISIRLISRTRISLHWFLEVIGPRYVPMELCDFVEGQIHPQKHLSRDAVKNLKNLCLPSSTVRQAAIPEM
ncbi:hypothetical protein HN51_065078, partial [Arachis hypogaea]